MPKMRMRDLPSLLTDGKEDQDAPDRLEPLREMCDIMDACEKKPKILINTSIEMEQNAIASISDKVDVYAIGPMPPDPSIVGAAALFDLDNKNYIHWLDAQPDNSVIYLSFGSIRNLTSQEVQAIANCLKDMGRPYLWVLRENRLMLELGSTDEEDGMQERGMVVEWCEQVRVLSHKAIGCFVTHCVWNSTTEGLVVGGVRMVGVPARWMDQGTNAWLIESEWGVGVRVEIDEGEGILRGEELKRCVEEVMGSEEMGKKARWWKERMEKMVEEGGMEKRLLEFVEEFVE